MRPTPTQQLNPKVKTVWRINDALWITIVCALCAIPFAALGASDADLAWASVVAGAIAILWIVLVIVFIAILPPFRFIRWRYELNSDFLDIQKGIFWRERIVIPFIRVQNTDTQQGPIMRAFGLANVTVSTAAGSHSIPGLDQAKAEELRDKAAELARIAREDV